MTAPRQGAFAFLYRPLTRPRLFLALAVVAVIVGLLVLLLWSYLSPSGNAWQSRRALQSLFRGADRFEMYATVPGRPDRLHVLGVVTQKEDPARWKAWIHDVGKARPGERYLMQSTVSLRFFRGKGELGQALWLGSQRQMTPVVRGRAFVQVEFESSLHGFLSGMAKRDAEARVRPYGKILQALFRRADRFEICTQRWPGESDTPRVLGVVTRQQDPARWESWTRDLDHVQRFGRPAAQKLGLHPEESDIYLHLYQGGRDLGEVVARPDSGSLAGADFGLLRFDSTLHATLLPFARRVTAAQTEAYLADLKNPPPTAPPRPSQVFAPSPKSFEESRQYFLQLFRDTTTLGLRGPFGAGDAEIRGAGRAAWNQMIRAVEHATPAPATGARELDLLCFRGRKSDFVSYGQGILQTSDPYAGGVYTLRPAKGFGEAAGTLYQSAATNGRRAAPGPREAAPPLR